MTDNLDLTEVTVMERDTTLNPRQLRAAGFLPATLYANGQGSRSIQVRTHEFELALNKGRRNFKLAGQGIDTAAQVRQFQVDPVKQTLLSVEFLEMDLKEAQAAMEKRRAELEAEARAREEAEARAREEAAKAAAREAAEAEAEAEPEGEGGQSEETSGEESGSQESEQSAEEAVTSA